MSVYVDDMQAEYYSHRLHRKLIMCHMLADTDEELRAMADKIGIAQRWHQGDHFDICKSMRDKAVKLGAIEITMRQAAEIRRRNKNATKL